MARVVRPATLAEAVALVRDSDGDAKYLSGGTALVLLVSLRTLSPTTLVSLRGIDDVPGLRTVAERDGVLHAGGGVTLAELAAHPLVRRRLPGLATAADVVGNIRIRNCATVGGMLAEADYASDPPAMLTALDARVLVHDGEHERAVPAHEFITDFYTTCLEPEEVVTGVTVPLPDGDARSVYLKFSSRSAEDRPCVGVAAAATFEGDDVTALRVVVGAVAGFPQWFPEITAPLLGAPLTAPAVRSVADAHADAVDPVDDLRGSAWYRREVVRAQVARALTALGTGEAP
ncbi:FAD binding domain-containing protein [Streptomyces sp. NPDC050560]|uniref:FAD binding domain-containing protein n=1 Tax=Streptomyces sp. NPDC050560 TaxID=3365630 RepID=UPI0037A5BC26